jgi:hypothetical protein
MSVLVGDACGPACCACKVYAKNVSSLPGGTHVPKELFILLKISTARRASVDLILI